MSQPEPEADRLAKYYRALATEELAKLAHEASTLSDDAKQALQSEISRRGAPISLALENRPTHELDLRDLVTVATFRDLSEALLAKAALESSGIECHLIDENVVRMDWFLSNLLGGIKLQVEPADLETAHEILEQPIPENFEVEGVGVFEQPRCPKCNSLDIYFEAMNKGIGYTTAWMAFPIPYPRNVWHCASCGQTWREDDAPDSTKESVEPS